MCPSYDSMHGYLKPFSVKAVTNNLYIEIMAQDLHDCL